MKTGKKLKRLTALLVVLVLLFSNSVHAAVGDDAIEQAWSDQSANEAQLLTAEDRIALLESQKNDSEAYLLELNNQLEDMAASISDISAQCAAKQAELDATKSNLAEMQIVADEQYDAMKIRIQYMYESGTAENFLVAMLSADNFTDFLNRAEMFSEINRFDREMLESYEATILEIDAQRTALETESQELAALHASLMEQRNTMTTVYDSAYRDMQSCIANLSSEQAAQADLIARIQAQDDYINELLAQQYAEERAAAEAAAAAAAQDQAINDWTVGAGSEGAYQEPVYVPGFVDVPSEDGGDEGAGEQGPAQEMPGYDEYFGDDGGAGDGAGSDGDSGDGGDGAGYDGGDASASGGTYLGNFTLTAYCACPICCGQWASGYTASGTLATPGRTVAMGGVPFGTQLLIDGHVYIVEDRGTSYGHVDIFFNDHGEALQFGMRTGDVYQLN